MKYIILFLFATSILLTSCTKEPLFHLSGRVLIEGTSTPIEDVELSFCSFIPSGEFGTPGLYKLIATVETNSKGEYSLTYNETFQTISIAAFKEGYFECSHPNTCLPAFSQEGEFERDLFLTAEAYLTFALIDTDLSDGFNSISLSPSYYNSATQSYLIKETAFLDGVIVSNKNHIYHYTLDGVKKFDSIFIAPFGLDTIFIEF